MVSSVSPSNSNFPTPSGSINIRLHPPGTPTHTAEQP